MRRIPLCFLGICLLAMLAPPAIAGTGSVRVEVTIDGVSELILGGNTAQWWHLNYDPPGTTTINGVSWTPTGLSNGCSCLSDVFTGVAPAIPLNATNFAVTVSDGRGVVSIQQYPSSGNGYKLYVRFDDGSQGGADFYDVTINYQYADPVPMLPWPTLVFVVLLLGVVGGWALRRT